MDKTMKKVLATLSVVLVLGTLAHGQEVRRAQLVKLPHKSFGQLIQEGYSTIFEGYAALDKEQAYIEGLKRQVEANDRKFEESLAAERAAGLLSDEAVERLQREHEQIVKEREQREQHNEMINQLRSIQNALRH
jgi:hypothetical protein